ncbi:MAG TPA: PH domain-containing protein [Thermomicrobiales bacterium]|nr:PH domain-containing protein [Thermomicrobiales bacterium]
MGDFDEHDISRPPRHSSTFDPETLEGWTVRLPSTQARRWSALNGLAHGLVWAFPFVAIALVWRRASGPDGDQLWPTIFFTIGMLLLIVLLIKGILVPRTWWFAYTEHELIVEHGLIIKARDHLAFDRVQYLERRSGPIMRPSGLASLIFDTAAGRAIVPAAELADIDTIEERVRVAMLRATVL